MSNTELVIDFSAEGTAQAMHMDGFDLGFLGAKSIQRATEIKFNERTQLWGLYLPDVANATNPVWARMPYGQGFPSYEVARQYEVVWINICRAKGLDYQTDQGCEVLRDIRKASEALGHTTCDWTVERFKEWEDFKAMEGY